MKSCVVYLMSVALILTGCHQWQQTHELEYALTLSGENRAELEKVLDYYSHDPVDSLKYRAAEFLIENLPYHYSYEGKIVDNYIKLYELHGTGKYSPEEVLDSITSTYGRFDYDRASIKIDTSIDPNYLKDNIEWAFKVWQEQPWGKNVTFENFCEYILPYRVGNERLTPWHEKIYNQFNPVLDSIRMLLEAEDPLLYRGSC